MRARVIRSTKCGVYRGVCGYEYVILVVVDGGGGGGGGDRFRVVVVGYGGSGCCG